MSQSIPPLIRPEHMKKDYACAALYNNAWYRGRIQGPANNGEVGIYYVDFGTVERVPVGSVRYIPKNFCSIPHLCHRGTLDFIKPMNYRWYIETTTVLIDLIADRKMMARVSEIDCKVSLFCIGWAKHHHWSLLFNFHRLIPFAYPLRIVRARWILTPCSWRWDMLFQTILELVSNIFFCPFTMNFNQFYLFQDRYQLHIADIQPS